MVVRLRVKSWSIMALGAKSIALFDQLHGVRVMAIPTGNAPCVHSTLHEGTPDVDLVQDLPVVVVEPA